MSLIPTAYKPKVGMYKKTVGIYGRPGIGKSTLASLFERTIVAQTEAGLEHLDVPRVVINSWDQPLSVVNEQRTVGGFLPFLRELVTGDYDYDRICIDTFDNLCRICTEFTCEQLNIDDIGDYKKFGAYHMVTSEIHRIIKKITNDTRFGLTMISHEKDEIIQTKTKEYAHKTISVSGKNRDQMLDICDILLHMSSRIDGDNEVGVIQTKPSIYYEAKDKGKTLPDEIVYDLRHPQQAYDQIQRAFKAKEEADDSKS